MLYLDRAYHRLLGFGETRKMGQLTAQAGPILMFRESASACSYTEPTVFSAHDKGGWQGRDSTKGIAYLSQS